MRLPLPGPGDVLASAAALRDGLGAALDLAPRAGALLARAEALLDGAEQTLARVDRLVGEVDATRGRAEALVGQVGAVVVAVEATRVHADDAASAIGATGRHAHAVADAAEGTRRRVEEVAAASAQTAADVSGRAGEVLDVATRVATGADTTLEQARGLVGTGAGLLDGFAPSLRALVPLAEQLAASVDGKEVDAAVALVDRLPVVLAHLDEDILPMLRQLDRVGPDVHELLVVVEDLRRVITGLPGVGFLRKRGDDEPR